MTQNPTESGAPIPLADDSQAGISHADKVGSKAPIVPAAKPVIDPQHAATELLADFKDELADHFGKLFIGDPALATRMMHDVTLTYNERTHEFWLTVPNDFSRAELTAVGFKPNEAQKFSRTKWTDSWVLSKEMMDQVKGNAGLTRSKEVETELRKAPGFDQAVIERMEDGRYIINNIKRDSDSPLFKMDEKSTETGLGDLPLNKIKRSAIIIPEAAVLAVMNKSEGQQLG